MARIVGQIGEALQAAHEVGILHRDVKPANILIDADGNAFLSDFGMALGGAPRALAPTLDAPYAAPEQRDGQEASAASDVFSLAVVAAESLTGHHGEIGELIVGMEPKVTDVLTRATAHDTTARFPGAGAFTAALLEALAVEAEATVRSRSVENPYKGLRAFQLSDADDFRFDASDLMPPEIGTDAFWEGMTRYLREGPESLEGIMAEIDATWSALEPAGD